MTFEYTLTDLEKKICVDGADMRYNIARSSGVSNGKIGPQSNRLTDQLGLGGELTVAKWLNLYPDFTIYVRQGGADLVTHSGTRIDVKTTTYATGRLLAKINTAYESIDVFVLVTTDYLYQNHRRPAFTVRGWATKEQLINPGNIINLGHGDGYGLTQDQLQVDTIL